MPYPWVKLKSKQLSRVVRQTRFLYRYLGGHRKDIFGCSGLIPPRFQIGSQQHFTLLLESYRSAVQHNMIFISPGDSRGSSTQKYKDFYVFLVQRLLDFLVFVY